MNLSDIHKEKTVGGKTTSEMYKQQSNTVSPMRLYVARCILDLKSNPSLKRAGTVLQRDNRGKKMIHEEISYSSRLMCPVMPSAGGELNVGEGYKTLIKILKAFDTIPVDQCIDINTFAEQCGASCYMILCVLTILNYLDLTSIVSNGVIKKSQNVSSNYIQEQIKSWNSSVISSEYTNRKGVLQKGDKDYPYIINPPHYEQPYHPEESLDITDNRVDWENIPSKYRSSSTNTELFGAGFCFDGIPIFCTSDRMAEIMEKYCYLFMRELVENKKISVYSLLSKTIHLNYLYISDRLCCLRLIIFTFQYLNLIHIHKQANTIESLSLSISDVLQVTPMFMNMITFKGEVSSQMSPTKEDSLLFFKDLIQQPVITANSVQMTLSKHFPMSNYPSVEELREVIYKYTNSILQQYDQFLTNQNQKK